MLIERLMQYITKKAIISIAMVLLGVGVGKYSNTYFELNVKYYAESAPVRNDGRSALRASPSPPATATTTTIKPSHCIQRSPGDLKDPHHAIELHPVSRLHEIQAKLHQSEPIFKVIGHRGEQSKNNREYQVQVMVNDKSASAWAHTKREAKRSAAIAMLKLMGLPVEGDGTNAVC